MSVEAVRQFVDTNVLVYAHDASAGTKHARAAELIKELWNSGTGCLSIQVLQEFYVSVTRKVPKPLDGATAAQLVSDLAQWTVHVPDVGDVVAAVEVHQRNAISFWDAMIIRSAAALGCAIVWSEDLNSGQVYQDVRVVNPFLT